MEDAELTQILERFKRGVCTPAELAKLEAWYEALGDKTPELDLSPEETNELRASLWQGIQQRIEEEAPSATPVINIKRPTRWVPWAAAAAVVIGLGYAAWTLRSQQPQLATKEAAQPAVSGWVFQNNTSRQDTLIALNDGSVVRLQPLSSLKYRQEFQGKERQVYLQGEAFFQVSHNPAKPFRVFTEKVVTTVLGTSFTIRAFANQPAEVIVRTGKVRVTPRATATHPDSAARGSVVVLPNQQVHFSKDTPTPQKALVAEPEILSAQPFRFVDRPVSEVLTALEKAYGVPITYDKAALANCTVNVTLNGQSLHKKLKVLCKTLNGSYEVAGTEIILHAKGCPKS